MYSTHQATLPAEPLKIAPEYTTIVMDEDHTEAAQLQDFYGSLQHALDTHRPIVIDATRVQRINTATLQMICVFVKEARAKGIDMQWQQPSPSLRDAAGLLGLSSLLTLE